MSNIVYLWYFYYTMKNQIHHIIPISIWWLDMSCNTLDIKESIHKQIHEILEWNKKFHYAYNRKTNKIINNVWFNTPYIIQQENEKQIMYFENYPILIKQYPNINHNYINKIKEALLQLIIYMDFGKWSQNIDNITNREKWHIMYCDARLAQSYHLMHIYKSWFEKFNKSINSTLESLNNLNAVWDFVENISRFMPSIKKEVNHYKINFLTCLNIAQAFAWFDEKSKSEYISNINQNYITYIHEQLTKIKKICTSINWQFLLHKNIFWDKEVTKIYQKNREIISKISININHIENLSKYIYHHIHAQNSYNSKAKI